MISSAEAIVNLTEKGELEAASQPQNPPRPEFTLSGSEGLLCVSKVLLAVPEIQSTELQS